MSTVNGFQVGSETLKYNYESLENYNTPEFSTTKTYAVGDYVIYQGKLYKCTTAVTTAGSWSSSNWTLAVLSDDVRDINNAIGDVYPKVYIDYSELSYFVGTISPSTNKWSTSNNPTSYMVSVPDDAINLRITSNLTAGARVALLKDNDHTLNTTPNYATGSTITFIPEGETTTFIIPDDCEYVWIARTTGSSQDNRIPAISVFEIAKNVADRLSELDTEIDNLDINIDELQAEAGELDIRVTELENNDNFTNGIFDAEIVGFICYGQSWSMGYDTNAITGTQRYDNIMLDSGLMNDPATDLVISATSFSPLIEQTVWSSTSYSQKCGETPCTGQTDIIKQLLLSENGLNDTDIKYQIFSAAPGMGSKSIEQLSKGTDYYTRLIDVVTTANNIARAQGKVFVVPAISWTQGSSTESDATYYDLLEQLRVDLDTDIKAITGQTITVKLIAWQAITPSTTPKRFYDRYVYASEKYENIICSGTFYMFDHKADNNLHLTADSQDWLGCQLGIAYKRSIVDGEKFIPLKPKSVEVYGNIAYLDFYVPVKPIVFDTTLVASISNYGFQIFDNSNTEKTISSVEIIAPDRVKIVCASNFALTDHIVYGGNGTDAYNPQTGKRGNLRDSQPIVYKNHQNVDLPCYNWCVVFDKTIAELTPST